MRTEVDKEKRQMGVLGKPRVSEGLRESDMVGVKEELRVRPGRVNKWLSNARATQLTHLFPEIRGCHAQLGFNDPRWKCAREM